MDIGGNVKIDMYTKVILTVIAVDLVHLSIRSLYEPTRALAQSPLAL